MFWVPAGVIPQSSASEVLSIHFSGGTAAREGVSARLRPLQSDLNKVISSCNDIRINPVVFPYFLLETHTLAVYFFS
jgi:hypothetical protein